MTKKAPFVLVTPSMILSQYLNCLKEHIPELNHAISPGLDQIKGVKNLIIRRQTIKDQILSRYNSTTQREEAVIASTALKDGEIKHEGGSGQAPSIEKVRKVLPLVLFDRVPLSSAFGTSGSSRSARNMLHDNLNFLETGDIANVSAVMVKMDVPLLFIFPDIISLERQEILAVMRRGLFSSTKFTIKIPQMMNKDGSPIDPNVTSELEYRAEFPDAGDDTTNILELDVFPYENGTGHSFYSMQMKATITGPVLMAEVEKETKYIGQIILKLCAFNGIEDGMLLPHPDTLPDTETIVIEQK